MLAAALEAEVEAYVSSLTHEVDEHGHRLVVRNGHAEPRSLVTGAGPLEVRAPRVDDRRVDEGTGERMRFRSSILPAARAALADVRDAEDREHALKALALFKKDYEAKWPKAVEKVIKDADALLAFFDFPAEHWVHLKTTNPIESTFATVRLRTKVTKGPGSRAAGLAMAYKLIESAQTRWRAVNAPQLVALVRAGVVFEKGVMAERSEMDENEVAA